MDKVLKKMLDEEKISRSAYVKLEGGMRQISRSYWRGKWIDNVRMSR